MSAHATIVIEPCPDCSQPHEVRYRTLIYAGVFRFSASSRCARCGHALEVDGDALTPEARRAFYAAEGRWSLVVSSLGPKGAQALKVLRQFLDQPASSIMQLVKSGQPIVTGALAEIEPLEVSLIGAGASTTRVREPTSPSDT